MSSGIADRPIALIGFMGCGKSAVGRRLARKLGYAFLDTDHMVEAAAGMSIADLFAQQGEETFREMEAQALAEALASGRCVISTGGGITTIDSNRKLLLDRAAVVLLECEPEEILRRVKPLEKRPMLAGHPDPLERIRQLLAEREPFYRDYHFSVDTTASWPGRTADRIVTWYKNYRMQQQASAGGCSG